MHNNAAKLTIETIAVIIYKLLSLAYNERK